MLLIFLMAGFAFGFIVCKKIRENRKCLDSDQTDRFALQKQQSQFSAQVYHDLQSPLAALLFLTKSLEKADDATKAHLSEVAQHLQKISNRHLEQFSDKQSSKGHPLDETKSSENLRDGGDWKADQIQIVLPCHFVILDDQPFAHEQWELKFKTDLKPEQEKQITRHHLNSHAEFIKWYQDHDYGSLENVLYLFDMDLGPHSVKTGLELIDHLNLQTRAILVTNQAEDPRVQKLCIKNKVHMLPKSEIALIPFEFI